VRERENNVMEIVPIALLVVALLLAMPICVVVFLKWVNLVNDIFK
jgi:hypothetical protein